MTYNLNIFSWNCKGVMSTVTYLDSCLKKLKIDICALSEHWLRKCNIHFLKQINSDYKPYAKSVDEYLPMHQKCTNYRKGVALLVSSQIDRYVVREIETDSDRIVGIELNLPNVTPIFFFCVYLPSSSNPFEDFKEHVEILRELTHIYSQCGKVMLAGDFNAQINGPRHTSAINERNECLQEFVNEFDLLSLNMQNSCLGPIDTFQGYIYGPSTPIDHILISTELLDKANNIKVLSDCGLNISDHLPITCSLVVNSIAKPMQNTTIPTKIAWTKAIENGCIFDYTFAVSQNLWSVDMDQTDIETYYEEIISAIDSAANDVLPVVTFKRHLKPYWNSQLTYLHNQMLQLRDKWISENRPRGFENESYRLYKLSKKTFRDESRKAYDNYVLQTSNDIERSLELDQRLAWSIIRSRKSTCSSDTYLKINSKIINEPEKICDEFANFFENIAKNVTHVEDVNIENKLNEIRNKCDNGNVKEVNTDELSKLVGQLPSKKACGLDRIFYEHIKYGGKLLLKHLCNLFNLIFEQCITPRSWKTSVVIPLFKGGNKQKSNIDSYRGISLIPSISKIFEKLVDIRLNDLISNFPNKQQTAYQKNISSIHASFNLQEVVNHYRERNTSAKVVFLDSKKAFDTVDHSRLKIKLEQLGVNGKLWTLLDHMYSQLNSRVKYNNCVSKSFNLERGVRQGSALSAKLYLVYINNLIDQLTNSGYGAMIIDLKVGNPVQADDIALIAPTYPALQSMLDICYQYSQMFKFEFSPAKSEVMVFECGRKEQKRDLLMNTEIIPVNECVKHVGILLESTFNSLARTQAACRTIRAVCMSIIKLGIHPSILNPITCSKIILQLCYSKGLYGCELWNGLTNNEQLLLERTHRMICKYVQSLPKLTRTDKCTSLLGWTSMECVIEMQKLFFMGRLINMPSNYLPKEVFMSRLLLYRLKCTKTNYGFVPDIMNILGKYELLDYIETLILTSEFPCQKRWKVIVKNRVYDFEETALRHRMDSDDEFRYFKHIHDSITPHRAWVILRSNPSLKKQSEFVVSLCALMKPDDPDNTILCHRCGHFFENPIVHILTQCNSLMETRDIFWMELINIGPIEFSTSLHQKDDLDLTLTLLSCNSDKVDDNLQIDEKDKFTITCVRFIQRLCNEYQD